VADVLRLGVLQPRAYWGTDAEANVGEAVRYMEAAAALGVELLSFPETYPGPYREDVRYESLERIRAAAARTGVSVVTGTTTETASGSGRYHVEAVVVDGEGEIRGRYRRSHPVGPYVFPAGAFWDIDYQEGDELPVFELEWGTLGIAICSEVFIPEIARTLALKGAEICVFPTGVLIDELGYTDNWRTMVRARAVENLMVTATSVHLFPREFISETYPHTGTGSGLTAGHAMICTPERVVAQSHEPGILTADIDLARIRLLRASEEVLEVPAPFRTLPGVLRWPREAMLDSARRSTVETS
jgi:predicted amidohydrolase